MVDLKKIAIRKLGIKEDIPYKLLLEADETIESINRYIHNSIIYVANLENKQIGVCAVMDIEANKAEIKNIAVDEKCRGFGVGSTLIDFVEKEVRKNGYSHLLIATADAGEKQLKLYRRLGFVDFAVRKNFFIDNFPAPLFENGRQLIDMVVLRKKL